MNLFNLKFHSAFLGMLSVGLICLSCESHIDRETELEQSLKTEAGSGTKKILVIGIDGCRQDVMMSSNTPNIQSLLTNAVYSLDAQTLAPSWSGNGWSTLLTGVTHLKHGITGNDFTVPHDFVNYPCFLKRAENYNAALRTMSIVHWAPINDYIMDGIDVERTFSTDADVKNNVVSTLNTDNPDILFVHFDDVDHAGHTYGFSSTVPEYVSAVNQTDIYVGEILTALRNRANYANEDWLIIVSPDHGGSGTSHSGVNFEDRNIFSIYHNKNFAPNKIDAKTLVSQSTINASIVNYNSKKVYAAISHTAFNFGITQDFTIECRVKTTSISGDPSIVSNKDWASGSNKGFIIAAQGGTWKANIGDGTNRADLEVGLPITDGNWHHITVTFSRTAGVMKAYQDGMYLGQTSIANLQDVISGLPLVIGQDGTKAYADYVNGQISEVRVWNTALDSSTVVNNSCSYVTASHPKYSNLIGYWKGLNDVNKNMLDSSPFARNMALSGTISRTNTNSSLKCYVANTIPWMVDYAYTALTWLGVPISQSWGLDGRSWLPSQQ